MASGALFVFVELSNLLLKHLIEVLIVEVAQDCFAAEQRENECVTLVRCAEFALDVFDVDANGIRTDIELLSNFLFRMTPPAQDEAIALSSGQKIPTLLRRRRDCSFVQ